ncbi:uncharacterized protein [Triticum aestivum]|uniref:uncharacterized protein isoform X1 n=1 Tax=Triticum aestivum TaxID=4565 RepID=UPI001ABC1208|nr:uncharacterized protein LOC109732593 isoform X1 [Aegilops tauschii subsp. strangulata]XP_044376472.1 uncharacterized protein LOC123098508 isoform X1 [Triticum aestivum]
MLMVGLAPCAFSLTEGDYSRKKSHGNVLPSVLSRQIQQCRFSYALRRHTIVLVQPSPNKTSKTFMDFSSLNQALDGSSTAQSPAVQSRCCGRAPLQLHRLCFTGERCDLRNHGG